MWWVITIVYCYNDSKDLQGLLFDCMPCCVTWADMPASEVGLDSHGTVRRSYDEYVPQNMSDRLRVIDFCTSSASSSVGMQFND